MKYHINPELGPRPCRAEKRPCKYDGEEHFANKKEAQESFEKDLRTEFGEINKVSKYDFSQSKAVDKEGKLLTVYHGSNTRIDTFDPSFTGKGNDSYGSGFYFNTNKETSSSYGQHLMKVNLNIKNPIVVDGRKDMSLNHVQIPLKAVKHMMRSVPNIYNQPDNDDMNPLGDYCEEYWEKDSHTKKELENMMDKVASQYYSDASFTEVENLFNREGASAFRKSLKEATGWDGVEVKFSDTESHWIAWEPEQIRIIK